MTHRGPLCRGRHADPRGRAGRLPHARSARSTSSSRRAPPASASAGPPASIRTSRRTIARPSSGARPIGSRPIARWSSASARRRCGRRSSSERPRSRQAAARCCCRCRCSSATNRRISRPTARTSAARCAPPACCTTSRTSPTASPRPQCSTFSQRSEFIVGIKDSSGSVENLAAFAQARNGQPWTLLVGDDRALFKGLQAGWDGGISGVAGFCPELLVAIYRSFVEGRRDEAARLQALLDELILAARAVPHAVGDSDWPGGARHRHRTSAASGHAGQAAPDRGVPRVAAGVAGAQRARGAVGASVAHAFVRVVPTFRSAHGLA